MNSPFEFKYWLISKGWYDIIKSNLINIEVVKNYFIGVRCKKYKFIFRCIVPIKKC